MSWEFLSRRVVEAMHIEQLRRHGGAAGLRDENVLESALARPENKAAYGDPSVHELAAAYLFDAWPRAAILAALGQEHAGRIPAQFHPVRVDWSIPVFIVRAMEHQAAGAVSPRRVDDYMADLLFNEIQPETLLAFRDDPGFLAAYHYPYRG